MGRHYPAMAVVEVNGAGRGPRASVEIEATAVVPEVTAGAVASSARGPLQLAAQTWISRPTSGLFHELPRPVHARAADECARVLQMAHPGGDAVAAGLTIGANHVSLV